MTTWRFTPRRRRKRDPADGFDRELRRRDRCGDGDPCAGGAEPSGVRADRRQARRAGRDGRRRAGGGARHPLRQLRRPQRDGRQPGAARPCQARRGAHRGDCGLAGSDRRAARPCRPRARRVGPAQRPQHRARVDPARRDRRDLRKPAERHRRRCGAVRDGGQRCHPPLGLGNGAFRPRHHPRDPNRAGIGRPAHRCGAAGTDARPRRRGRDAGWRRRHDRRDRPARRPGPCRADAAGGAHPGVRAPRGPLPRVPPRRRRPRDGGRRDGQRQDAPHRHLRCRRDPPDRRGLPAQRPSGAGGAGKGRVRAPRRRARARDHTR